jgi:hypothetical protein
VSEVNLGRDEYKKDKFYADLKNVDIPAHAPAKQIDNQKTQLLIYITEKSSRGTLVLEFKIPILV